MNVVLYLVVQTPQQLNTELISGSCLRSMEQEWEAFLRFKWKEMKGICSMGSVSQGRSPREAVQWLSWDVLRIQHDRVPSLVWFQCWPCFEQAIGLQSLLRAPPPLSILGLDPSGRVGYMEQCVYVVPGWNGLLSSGPNTETAFPFQQGLELCTPSSNFWSLAFLKLQGSLFHTRSMCGKQEGFNQYSFHFEIV